MPCFCGQQAVAVCSHCKFGRILNGTPDLSDLKVLRLFSPPNNTVRAIPKSSIHNFIFSVTRRKTSHMHHMCRETYSSALSLRCAVLINSTFCLSCSCTGSSNVEDILVLLTYAIVFTPHHRNVIRALGPPLALYTAPSDRVLFLSVSVFIFFKTRKSACQGGEMKQRRKAGCCMKLDLCLKQGVNYSYGSVLDLRKSHAFKILQCLSKNTGALSAKYAEYQ